MAEFKPKCGSSGIGSIPHKHYKKVVKNILEKFDFPYWPQIVKKGFIENMYVQYSEGMPCLEIDLENEKIHFNTNNDAGLYEWYEKVVNKDVDHFKMTSKRASGFHELIKKAGKKEYLKGQTTGPISFGLSVVDQDKKPILYNSQFLEVIVNSLAMKAAWQIRRLKEVSDNVIMFFDEPYLCSYGSAFTVLEKDVVVNSLNEVIKTAKEEGATTGIHCCGNTDWSLVMSTNTDIISFDAYNFSDRLALYPQEVKKFLERGAFAWGIVPTSEDILKEDSESLIKKLELKIEDFTKEGIDKALILEKAMITPSCGVGSLDKKSADKVLQIAVDVSKKLKEKYF